MKKNLSTIILILVFFVGLSVLLYPPLSNYYNSFHQSRSIAEYEEDLAKMTEKDYTAILERAQAYNQKLFTQPAHYINGEPEGEEYRSILSVSSDGMIGYISIDKIGVQLPIYHGTSERILAAGAGHLEGSSFPIGGESTHAVLTGHRGLPSSKLFTDLDKIEVGDTFVVRVLDETLTYEVDQIRIVEPEETADLEIVEKKDYCTLVTCTPYGVNSHRLLVRGKRIENEQEGTTLHVTADAIQVEPLLVAPLVAAPILLLLLIWLLISTRRKKSDRKH